MSDNQLYLPLNVYAVSNAQVRPVDGGRYCVTPNFTNTKSYGPTFSRGGNQITFTWTYTTSVSPNPDPPPTVLRDPTAPFGCHYLNNIGCSFATSGVLTLTGGTGAPQTVTLTAANRLTGPDPDAALLNYAASTNIVTPFYWLVDSSVFSNQGFGDVTCTATFDLDPAAPETLFTSGGITGPWAFWHANNWGMNIPFNLGTAGKLKPGEEYRNAVRYVLTKPSCVICDLLTGLWMPVSAVYTAINYLVPASSPGWGWSMGPSYAKLVQENDATDGSGPYLDFYDGSGAYERYTITGSGSSQTFAALYADNYATLILNPADQSYTMTFPDLSQMNFAPLTSVTNPGRITSMVDLNKNTTTFHYGDASNPARVTSIDDGENRTIYFSYGLDGQPSQISRQTNSSPTHYVNFTYLVPSNSDPTVFNPLTQITDALGNSQYFTYDPTTKLIAARWDTRNNPANSGSQPMVAYTYYTSGPNSGNLMTEQFDTGLVRTYFYQNVAAADGTTNLLVAIEEQDTVSTPTPATRYSATLYNQWSQPVTSWGPTTVALDLADYPANQPNPFGGATVINWQMQYQDPLNPYLMTQMVDPNLATSSWVYDDFGNTTQSTDALNYTTKYQYTSGVSPYLLTEIDPPLITAYGDSGPTLHSTTMAYDSVGNLSSITDSTSNSGHNTITFARTHMNSSGVSDGRITSITDRNLNTTTLAYTAVTDGTNVGNLKSVQFPSTAAMTGLLSFTYDAYDNRIGANDSINSVGYQWDDLQRLLQVIPTLSGTSTLWNYQDPNTGFSDRLHSVTLPDVAGLSSPVVGGSSGGRETFVSYDASSRLTAVNSQTFNGQNPGQLRVNYSYDSWSNLTQLGRLQSGTPRNYNFLYDEQDRMTQMNDPSVPSRTTSNTYQPYCRSYSQLTPRLITRKYTFDSLCRMASIEMGDEYNTVTYDAWGQVTSVTHQPSLFSSGANPSAPGLAYFGQARFSSPNAPQTKSFSYDQLGRLRVITYQNGKTITYDYDYEGNVLSVTDSTTAVTTSYTYYGDYKLDTVTMTSGATSQQFSYFYDSAGRLKKIVYPASTNIVAWIYNPATGTSNPQAGNGWDANGRMLGLLYTQNGNVLQSFAYTYDAAGNRSQIVDTSTPDASVTTWNYGYDYFGRLLGADNGTLRNVYAYDESDNRTKLSQTPGNTYDYAYLPDNELQYRYLDGNAPNSGDQWSSDLDGNLLSKTVSGVVSNYIFNDSNKLVNIQSGGSVEVNSYDAEGMREATDPSTLYYNSGSSPLTDANPSGAISFIQGHQLLGLQENGNYYFYLTDHLGSVRHVVDSTGTVKYSFSYTEFGAATGTSRVLPGDPSYLSALCQMMTYVGAYGVRNETATTGMYLMGQRWYDSSVGSFISQDPVSFAGGLNLYKYTTNPINFIDPDGLLEWTPEIAGDFGINLGRGGLSESASKVVIGTYLGSGAAITGGTLNAAAWRAYIWMVANPVKTAVAVGLAEGSTGHPGIGSPVSVPCPQRSAVALDTNAIDELVLAYRFKELLKGRAAIISNQAAKEYLRAPHGAPEDLLYIVRATGGRFSDAGSESLAQELQLQAEGLGRKLRDGDSLIAANAQAEGVPLITADGRLYRFMQSIGLDPEFFKPFIR